MLKPEEIRKLDAYFKRTFQNPHAAGEGAPAQGRFLRVYVGDEFLGIVFKDEGDGDLSTISRWRSSNIDLALHGASTGCPRLVRGD